MKVASILSRIPTVGAYKKTYMTGKIMIIPFIKRQEQSWGEM